MVIILKNLMESLKSKESWINFKPSYLHAGLRDDDDDDGVQD